MDSISLDAAEVMTGISRRTLWRRVADGMLTSADKDSRGRTTVVLDTALLGLLRDALGLDWSGQDAQDLALADAGNVQAQLNVGTRLYAATTPRTAPPPPIHEQTRAAALYWLQLAAQQGNADAMHWLGMAAAQEGTAAGNHQALAWLAQAATHGHAIAQQQMQALVQRALGQPGA